VRGSDGIRTEAWGWGLLARVRPGLRAIRRVVVGPGRDVYAPAIYAQVTVGALLAWIAVGGDLLGSSVYGPDTLGRAVRAPSALLVVGGATLLTLGILAAAYHRLNRRFLHGGGGYTAARALLGERPALLSGVALLLDAGVDVAVSVVFCMEALASLVPVEWHWLKLPIELAIILALTAINVRGIRESARSLAPIVALFVLTHVVILTWAVLARGPAIAAHVAAVPGDLAHLAATKGRWGTFSILLLGFVGSGAAYTGIECVSNAAPLLREPRARTSKRTMALVAGVPALIIGLFLLGYVLYDVRVEGDRALNAIFFERVAAAWAGGSPTMRTLLVLPPLVAEALLLVVAAQTGFSDGPRTLGALAADRFVPRSLLRLNARLMPERGIYLIGGIAFGTTLLVGGRLAPLVAIFVTCVFVTVSLSQIAMLKDALTPGARSATGIVVHGLALTLSLIILVGTVATNLATVALAAPLLIGTLVVLCWRLRRRHLVLWHALDGAGPLPAPQVAGTASPDEIAAARWVVALVGERPGFGQLELAWIRQHAPHALGITFASVALVDAETIHGLDRIVAVEETRGPQLEALAAQARALGLQADVALLRAGDLIAGAAALAHDLARARPPPALVVGTRLQLGPSLLDRLARDDVASPIAARLAKVDLPMVVLEVSLPAAAAPRP
jgi:amino acid transporter